MSFPQLFTAYDVRKFQSAKTINSSSIHDYMINISQAIDGLSNISGVGPDDVSLMFLRNCRFMLSRILHRILSALLLEGEFPQR